MAQIKEAVLSTVVNYLGDYAQKHIENCMEATAASTPVLFFGTNQNEVFRSAEEIRSALAQDFSNMDDIEWSNHRYLHVEISATLASVLIELTLTYRSSGKMVETPFRYAFTLIKEDARWKICSGLASVPSAAGSYTF